MKFTIKKITPFIIGALLLSGGCTKLDEELFGSLSPDNYYNTEAEALSSVVGVYRLLSYTADIGDPWRLGMFATDEFIVPGRASGGWYDQSNIDITMHKMDANNATSGRAWNFIFQEIGTANAIIEALQKSPNAANLKAIIAETRALRAYGYFYAMDYWGNIPLVTVARIDPNNLPETTPRAEIFKFIEAEMLAAAADMPSVTTVNRATYYPRFTKESVYSLLAILYLNAEVYTGTPQWTKAIEMSDKVIGTGAFELEPAVINCFTSAKQAASKEIISAFSIDPTKNAGNNQFILYTQNALDQKKYNLPFVPANGYSSTQAALDRYEDQDVRKSLIEYGPQTYLDGTPLKYANGTQLVLVPVKDIVAAQDNEGYKVLKYTPVGTSWNGYNGDNDLILVRYAEILLTKAEALFRTGKAAEALPIINAIRKRSNATEKTSLTLKDLEDERARELLWEGQRRRDMIRFGTYFTGTWPFKTTTTAATKGIFAIPNEQITANPKLKQNPGY